MEVSVPIPTVTHHHRQAVDAVDADSGGGGGGVEDMPVSVPVYFTIIHAAKVVHSYSTVSDTVHGVLSVRVGTTCRAYQGSAEKKFMALRLTFHDDSLRHALKLCDNPATFLAQTFSFIVRHDGDHDDHGDGDNHGGGSLGTVTSSGKSSNGQMWFELIVDWNAIIGNSSTSASASSTSTIPKKKRKCSSGRSSRSVLIEMQKNTVVSTIKVLDMITTVVNTLLDSVSKTFEYSFFSTVHVFVDQNGARRLPIKIFETVLRKNFGVDDDGGGGEDGGGGKGGKGKEEDEGGEGRGGEDGLVLLTQVSQGEGEAPITGGSPHHHRAKPPRLS